jgi:hypothetical protein
VRSDPARLTFAGKPARLAETVRSMTSALSAWPAARRVAIHGLADAELSPSADEAPKEIRREPVKDSARHR